MYALSPHGAHRSEYFGTHCREHGCAQWLAASSATAVLVVLSWFNAVHSPAFDCVRASAYMLRSRRSGQSVSLATLTQLNVPGIVIVTAAVKTLR